MSFKVIAECSPLPINAKSMVTSYCQNSASILYVNVHSVTCTSHDFCAISPKIRNKKKIKNLLKVWKVCDANESKRRLDAYRCNCSVSLPFARPVARHTPLSELRLVEQAQPPPRARSQPSSSSAVAFVQPAPAVPGCVDSFLHSLKEKSAL